MPDPRQVAVSGAGRFWVRKNAASAPALRVSSASSAKEASPSYSPVSRHTSSARWGFVSLSNNAAASPKFLPVLYQKGPRPATPQARKRAAPQGAALFPYSVSSPVRVSSHAR